MSKNTDKTHTQAGHPDGSHRKMTTLPSDPQRLATSRKTLALPGCEATESEARQLNAEIVALGRKALVDAVRLGGILTDLKAELKGARPRRNWEPYVRAHLGIHQRTASNYMRLFRHATHFDSFCRLVNSENLSEIGVRRTLDTLARQKGSGQTPPASSGKAERTGGRDPGTSQAGTGKAPFGLADGSCIEPRRLRWVDGIISRRAIEASMLDIGADLDTPEKRKTGAMRQSAAIQIAAVINRVCVDVEPSAALSLLDPSFEAIRKILDQLELD